MNLQKTIPLSSIYKREEDFSTDLADTLDALRIGSFEDVKTEVRVGTRRADIVAAGEDGTLVIENQFGKADWDHWGRLEAYARLKDATVAVLVLCHWLSDGYNLLSLMRASCVVNRQLTVARC